MRLRHRLSLVALGAIIFLIITPVLVFYARGFVFNWSSRTLVKTGAIVVKTDPTGARVYLNNKKQDGNTPLNLRFLFPADYDVRIEKNGYQSWQKRLAVKSQLVTWTDFDREFVTLFFQNPTLKQTFTSARISLSQNRQQLTFIDEHEAVNFLDVNNNTITSRDGVTQISAPLNFKNQLTWDNGPRVYDAINYTAANNPATWAQIQTAQLIFSNGDYTVFALNSDLYYLGSQTAEILDKNISGFVLAGSDIWYIQKNLLKHTNLANNQSTIISSDVPIAQTVQIIRADNQIFAILDNSLYILTEKFEKISDHVNLATWDGTAKLLVFTNDNSILTYNPTTKTTDLILRSTTAIKNPILNWPTGYVFFANDGKIKTIEFDGRDQRNVYTLADDLGNFTISSDASRLYVFNDKEIKEYVIR